MPRFFVENNDNGSFEKDKIIIRGDDAAHISKVLRMKAGENLIVCDCKGSDYFCEITDSQPSCVILKVLEIKKSVSEPSVKVTLYQGMPKNDKMDLIVQKSVELGVFSIVPVITKRAVSRPDAKSLKKKTERWNKIAEEAAKQSGRGILVNVKDTVSFDEALKLMSAHDLPLMLYEKNGGSLKEHLDKLSENSKEIGILIGPEGGFDEEEAKKAKESGIILAGMGPRILRTETAPLCALSCIMFATGNI